MTDSLHPLASVLARIDALLHRALEAAHAVDAAPGVDALGGLYVSSEEARRIVRRGCETLASRFPGLRPIVPVDEVGGPWRYLAAAFGLTPPEVDVLAVALAPEADLRYERVFGCLQDDLARRRPTVDLLLQLLCESFDERRAASELFAASAPLRRFGLVELLPDATQAGAPAIACAVKLDDGVAAFLMGAHGLDARLGGAVLADIAPAARSLPADYRAIAERLGDTSPEAVKDHLLLAGGDERGKRDLARAAGLATGRPLFVVDTLALSRLEIPFARASLLAAREARLHGALTLWTRADALVTDDGDGGRLEALLDAADTMEIGRVVISCREGPRPGSRAGGRLRIVPLPALSVPARAALWREALDEAGIAAAADDVRLLAEIFPFDGEAVTRAVRDAEGAARWGHPARPAVTRTDLFAGAHAQRARLLPRLAQRVEPAASWDDLVLPADQLRQLRELCDRVSHRGTVLGDWGFDARMPLGRGVAALFAGPSGSGKTMAAQVVAGALGLELYRVDIPGVVSKYIGETEKLLDQLFREAQGASAILFFDEADALFGKRSEVRDAHDRYANIEVSYLLQALEQFDGLALLASNLRHNLDDAFVRRLAFVVNFPMPDERERERIWERSWPSATPLGDDVDARVLARQFKLSGGNIRNVALAAAYAAAAEGDCVRMTHVIGGVRREFQKMGRTCAESEFGLFAELLTPAGVQ